MKKVFLFLAVSALTFSATSCEKDEDKGGNPGSMGTLTCTIQGTAKTFNNVVAQNMQGAGLTVMAFNGSQAAPTESITFVVSPDETGTDAMMEQGFMYMADNKIYSDSADEFELNVATNSTTAKTLKGTFNGTVEGMTEADGTKIIANGTFDIKYK